MTIKIFSSNIISIIADIDNTDGLPKDIESEIMNPLIILENTEMYYIKNE